MEQLRQLEIWYPFSTLRFGWSSAAVRAPQVLLPTSPGGATSLLLGMQEHITCLPLNYAQIRCQSGCSGLTLLQHCRFEYQHSTLYKWIRNPLPVRSSQSICSVGFSFPAYKALQLQVLGCHCFCAPGLFCVPMVAKRKQSDME